jgi:glycosyltransferase involved in cell wall biosynthesis
MESELDQGWSWPLPDRKVALSIPPPPLSRKIKILHVITKFSTGAGGNTLLSATGMDPARYEIWVAACSQGPSWERPLWRRAEEAGVQTVQLPRLKETISPRDDLVVLLQLIRLIRRERFDIVHTHTAKGGVLGRVAARLCRTPVVVHTFHSFSFHGVMGPARRRAYLFVERLMRPLTDAFLAVAPQVSREAVQQRVAGPGLVRAVPSAIDIDEIPMEPDLSIREELEIPAGTPLIGTVGRLDTQKAPLDFVKMAARVAKRFPQACFVMVGDGPLIDAVRKEAARLGVNIHLTGFRDDAPRIASAFDVFVISSLYEGLGRALTEGMASGRPVVATAVQGVSDLVKPGVTGLLTPAHSPSALAECVVWLLEHPAEAAAMGAQGRAAVLSMFLPHQMCAELDDFYSRLLGLPTPSQPMFVREPPEPLTVGAI